VDDWPVPDRSGRPSDTSPEAWRVTVEQWRTIGPGAKAERANQLSIDVDRLARAGILAVEPDADEARVRYLLLRRRYGRQLADAVSGRTV
jgi:hypothetical protein